jgi:NAD(P)-dependent dehydrogenase (short-subunit alcohol dehydrogenase family)
MHYSDLRDKTVFICGAGGAIGSGLAGAFAEQNCNLTLAYRRTKPQFNGTQAIKLIKADITNLDVIKKWLKILEKNGKNVDVLINNAGINEESALINLTPLTWDRIQNVNLKGAFFLSQLFAKHMQKHGGGVIINTNSFAANLPSIGSGAYACSKAGLASLTKSMAAEWSQYGIRVNAFSPGVIPSRLTNTKIKNNRQHMLSQIALGRFGEAAEVANAALFLASEQSSYITGVDLDISGGKLIVQPSKK